MISAGRDRCRRRWQRYRRMPRERKREARRGSIAPQAYKGASARQDEQGDAQNDGGVYRRAVPAQLCRGLSAAAVRGTFGGRGAPPGAAGIGRGAGRRVRRRRLPAGDGLSAPSPVQIGRGGPGPADRLWGKPPSAAGNAGLLRGIRSLCRRDPGPGAVGREGAHAGKRRILLRHGPAPHPALGGGVLRGHHPALPTLRPATPPHGRSWCLRCLPWTGGGWH